MVNLERLSQLSCRNSGIYPAANRVPTLDFELIEDDARQLKAVKAKLKILDFKKTKKNLASSRLSFHSSAVNEIIKSCTRSRVLAENVLWSRF